MDFPPVTPAWSFRTVPDNVQLFPEAEGLGSALWHHQIWAWGGQDPAQNLPSPPLHTQLFLKILGICILIN